MIKLYSSEVTLLKLSNKLTMRGCRVAAVDVPHLVGEPVGHQGRHYTGLVLTRVWLPLLTASNTSCHRSRWCMLKVAH